MSYILETKNIIKDFPGVRALDHVSFKVKKGEIIALCGENGAGKSTLISVLGGIYPYGTYEGDIILNDKKIKFENIKDAEKNGIAVIHQELALFENLNIMENMFAGNEITKNGIIDWNALYNQTEKWIKKLKIENVTPNTKIKDIGVGKQQLVEIGKALIKDSKILILDEPTDSFADEEVNLLLEILDDLRKDGVTCIYISHKLNEVFRIANSVTILRDGLSVGNYRIEDITEKDVVSHMVGREITQMYPKREIEFGDTQIEIKNFNAFSPETEEKIIKDVNFSVRKGEILGISGLVGAGRSELVNSIYGVFRGKVDGEIYINDELVKIDNAKQAMQHGLALVPEDRKEYGLINTMNVSNNISIVGLEKYRERISINQSKELTDVKKMVKYLNVKTASLETNIMNLSGGNQQKIVLAKNILINPKVLILDEPTRGIDVGAKHEIYEIMNQLTLEGHSIIMVSSELPEVLGMSDSIIVLSEGKITGRFDNRNDSITQDMIMACSTGGN